MLVRQQYIGLSNMPSQQRTNFSGSKGASKQRGVKFLQQNLHGFGTSNKLPESDLKNSKLAL